MIEPQTDAGDPATDLECPPATPKTPHSGRTRWRVLTLLVILGIAGGVGSLAIQRGHVPHPFHSMLPKARASITPATPVESARLVKVIKPKRASSVAITVDQLATVEPFYRADLRARASGIVKAVHYDIGDKVSKGEVLLEIDVPESEQDVAKCQAVIEQRMKELKVSEAKLKDAKAARDVSLATIKQREADVQAAVATRDLKQRKFSRFKDLENRGSVVGSVVEEEERDYLASEASVISAKANVERARADFAEAESKIEAAVADIELKTAQIEVARRDLDRAKVVADYARIKAPFDGVIVRRTVDEGSFVQNATTGSSDALISVAKVDLVTVAAKFPDAVAPFIAVNTPALVTVDDLPGVSIRAHVTRLAPSVQNADRTMRVEVDIFNGDENEYRQLIERTHSQRTTRQVKSSQDPLPVRAFPAETPTSHRLIPGMAGKIQLTIGGFGNSYVLPTSAVYSRSGTSYILLVEDGVTKQVPVRVQVNDGQAVRLALVQKHNDFDGSSADALTELTGQEQVIVARQLEIGDGAKVQTGLSDW